MIKINLLPKQKKFQMPVVLGIDLGKLNLKLIVVFIVLHYLGTGFVKDFFQGQVEELEAEVTAISNQRSKLRAENRKYSGIQSQIKELITQERNLQSRKQVVESIISTKKNPVKLMLYISKNIPDDIWLEKMEVSGNVLNIDGYALSFKSIRVFMDNLQRSVYFDQRFQIGKSETVTDEQGNRKERFSISGQVERYN